MKRLFTLAVIALTASLTFAQAPLAKKSAVSAHRIERMANVEEIAKAAKETKVLEVAQAAKSAAAKETGFSVLRRSSVNRGFAMQMEETVTNNWKPLNYRKDLVAKPFKAVVNNATTQEGNVTVTTDEHGIITDVTGVEAKVYARATTGTAYFLSNGSMSYTAQSGTVSIVEDGDNVYIKNPITRYTTGAWVKGTKNGNIITVAAGQPLYYNSSASATSNLRWGAITSTGSITVDDSHAEAFTFTVDGNVLTLEGTAAFGSVSGNAYYMGAFWSHNNAATGYGDAETVLTYDDSYVAPTTELVVLPTGAQADAWYMNAVSKSSSGGTAIKNQSVNVAFFDNDVYVQGISAAFPNAWVKGTISGNTVTFSNFQYVGKYSTYDCWFVGVNPETGEMKTVTATYDAEAKTITFADDALINASIDEIYYLNWFSNVVVSEEEIEYPEPIVLPNGAQTEDWYMNAGTLDENQAEVAVTNQKIKVAFVDNDVYVQGITTTLPTAWVKGTIDGTTVTFDAFQFVGEYSGLSCWFVGVNPNTGELKDVTATYDAEAKTITFVDDVLINAAKDKVYYLDWFFDVVLSEEK
ncbi:MAG: hypothetical protein K2J96_02195, partial [Bacteroidaceae bacterium]|nr:hypothetical protein [Bacteroidaceae bacterium]